MVDKLANQRNPSISLFQENSIMNKKSFCAILTAGIISSVLSGCGTLDTLIPPQPVGNGAQLEGPVASGSDWQPYNNAPSTSTSMPVPTSPDPNWRSAAVSGAVRAEPLEPVTRAVPVDPSFSDTGSVRTRIDDLKNNESSWGTYSGAGAVSENRAYSSRPERQAVKSNIYSPWAERTVGPADKTAFDRMVMEAMRTGGSRLTLRDGRYLSADRLDSATPGGCVTVVVKASTNEVSPPISTGEATVCN
jgi:hypothetical protein